MLMNRMSIASRSMRIERVVPWGLLGALLAGVAIACAAAAPSREPGSLGADGVLFPPNRAVLLALSFDVICMADAPSLQIDGKPRPWQAFEPPLRVARVRLSPGVHDLQMGERRREIVVALNELEHDGPADWPIYRVHEMSAEENRCGDCHQTKVAGGRVSVGPVKPHEACLACHKPVEFGAIHSHPLEPLEHCQMCHVLHASPIKGLLRAPAKTLCARCHES